MTHRRPSRAMAALCGDGGALALGVAELIAGLVPGAPSPVLSIGALLISLQPPNAKTAWRSTCSVRPTRRLRSVAVVLGALALSAGIGLLARRSLVAGRVAFGGLGLFALLAACWIHCSTRCWRSRPRRSPLRSAPGRWAGCMRLATRAASRRPG